jgi:hypothetical protein
MLTDRMKKKEEKKIITSLIDSLLEVTAPH